MRYKDLPLFLPPYRIPGMIGVMPRNIMLLALAAMLFLLPGCQGRKSRLEAQIDAGALADTRSRRYEDAEVFFERPGHWTVTRAAGADANIHALDMQSTAGVYARLTLVRESPAPGALPAEIIENLKRKNDSVQAEPAELALAGRSAKGFRYRFKSEGKDFAGHVVSFGQDRVEVCFLGQYPAELPQLQRDEIELLMKKVRLKNLAQKDAR